MNTVKDDGDTQMVVILAIKEMSCLVEELFDDLVRPLCIHIWDIKFFGYAFCLNSTIARKGAMPSQKSYNLFC